MEWIGACGRKPQHISANANVNIGSSKLLQYRSNLLRRAMMLVIVCGAVVACRVTPVRSALVCRAEASVDNRNALEISSAAFAAITLSF
jgi:hypothetical protein